MLVFSIVREDSVTGFSCSSRCPAMEYFEPGKSELHAPSVYDDYFRKYAPAKQEHIQKQGIGYFDGASVDEFWGFCLELSVYIVGALGNPEVVESYEKAIEYIDEIKGDRERKRKKMMLMQRLGKVHSMLKNPGKKIDSLESFGLFLHLLISGCVEHLGEHAKVDIEVHQDVENLEVYEDFFNREE
jgi:hypothetical protein